MKYDVELDSVVMIHVPSFIQIGSGIQQLIRRWYAETQTEWSSLQPTLGK
jgi:hypothetical protein